MIGFFALSDQRKLRVVFLLESIRFHRKKNLTQSIYYLLKQVDHSLVAVAPCERTGFVYSAARNLCLI